MVLLDQMRGGVEHPETTEKYVRWSVYLQMRYGYVL